METPAASSPLGEVAVAIPLGIVGTDDADRENETEQFSKCPVRALSRAPFLWGGRPNRAADCPGDHAGQDGGSIEHLFEQPLGILAATQLGSFGHDRSASAGNAKLRRVVQ